MVLNEKIVLVKTYREIYEEKNAPQSEATKPTNTYARVQSTKENIQCNIEYEIINLHIYQ